MAMQDKVEITTTIKDIYAETGVAANTEMRLQNQSNWNMFVFTGDAMPPNKDKAFTLKPDQSEFYIGGVIAVWSDVDKVDLQTETAQLCLRRQKNLPRFT